MTPADLDALDRKYRKFMPLPSATQIIKLIDYTWKLEKALLDVNEWANGMVKVLENE